MGIQPPKSFMRNDIKDNNHQKYIDNGTYFVIYENGEMGISGYHHAVGFTSGKRDSDGNLIEVKYWYSPNKNQDCLHDFNERENVITSAPYRCIICGDIKEYD